ncbi:MAG: flavodoxin-dependent (E)-4-hydroxy-3-methylbut-2-enyl-diphosphate synthase [Candidatus Gracilibacteria bacterium]|nr:flavodoxin-dependent (E)-4-hydroxy-3-methylbut-2-enyl-diphosphate synthase [Candidatus Gracilibacteria bacterium]
MKTNSIQIGSLQLGGENPIRIQSMTNTPTADIDATVGQIVELFKAGSELVRITVNDSKASEAVPLIRRKLEEMKLMIPLIGDFHFNGHILLCRFPEMAQALDKWRINPGNVGMGKKRDENFEKIIQLAVQYEKPIRIGVNAGSLDQELLAKMMDANASIMVPISDEEVLIEAMVKSALQSASLAEKIGMNEENIIISVKMSEVKSMVKAYELLDKKLGELGKAYPLHLGLTEAGSGIQGLVSSSAALGILLNKGIGDTIRISLTPSPAGNRTDEVEACKQLLQSLGLRSFSPKVTSCPGCGRTDNKRYQELAEEVKKYIEEQMPVWKEKYLGVENMKVAIMGCVVNGPGESKAADIGISLPGSSEEPVAEIFQNGVSIKKLKDCDISQEFKKSILKYIQNTYA